jgi:hypothetical protein
VVRSCYRVAYGAVRRSPTCVRRCRHRVALDNPSPVRDFQSVAGRTVRPRRSPSRSKRPPQSQQIARFSQRRRDMPIAWSLLDIGEIAGGNRLRSGHTRGKVSLRYDPLNVCLTRAVSHSYKKPSAPSSPFQSGADTVVVPERDDVPDYTARSRAQGIRDWFFRAKDWLDGPGANNRVDCGART